MTPKQQYSAAVKCYGSVSYVYTSCSYILSTHQHYNNIGLKLLVHLYILHGSIRPHAMHSLVAMISCQES